MAWAADYGCSTSAFTSNERTGKPALLYHDGLTEIAQLHSEDMAVHGFMDHDSWDGTSFGDRVWPYYPGTTIGENVAAGYSDNAAAVWQGWMCSAGHRENIMSAAFTDLGCGERNAYYTQDFGGGASRPHQPVAMGVHIPERPQGSVTFLATFDGSSPAWFGVETPTACVELERIVGSDSLGGWKIQVAAEDGCVPYRLVWSTQGGVRKAMPSTGAYQYGMGCDPWTAAAPSGCGDEPDPEDSAPWDSGEPCAPNDRNCDGSPDGTVDGSPGPGCGCSGGTATGGVWLGLMGLLGLCLPTWRPQPAELRRYGHDSTKSPGSLHRSCTAVLHHCSPPHSTPPSSAEEQASWLRAPTDSRP